MRRLPSTSTTPAARRSARLLPTSTAWKLAGNGTSKPSRPEKAPPISFPSCRASEQVVGTHGGQGRPAVQPWPPLETLRTGETQGEVADSRSGLHDGGG